MLITSDSPFAVGLQPGILFPAGADMGQPQVDFRAQKQFGILPQSFDDGGGERADTGDRGDTHRKTGEENTKAFQAAAQFTAGIGKGE